MIKNVSIVDIGVYREAEVDLDRGKIAVVGENGSGKTTLLRCINMGIWGDSRYILGGNVDDFIRIGEPSGLVEVTFERGGSEYTVKRRWNRSGRNTAVLVTPGGEISGIAQVSEEVERIFGMPSKNWVDITWARQGEIASLLRGDKDVFDRLLGISDLENAWYRLREVSRAALAERDALSKVIDELSQGVSEASEVDERLSSLRSDEARLRAELSALSPSSERGDVSDQIVASRSRISVLEKGIRELEKAIGSEGRCPLCRQVITDEHRRFLEEARQKKSDDLERERYFLSELETMESEYKEEAARNREIDIRKAKLGSDLSHTKEMISELNRQASRIQEIREKLAEHERARRQLKAELKVISAFRDGYRLAQPYLRAGRISRLKHGVLSCFEDMFGDRFSQFDIDEDYGMTVWEDGIPRKVATLSGGESIALAIALRLSIVNEIGGQDTLILDEPTSHLDEERVRQLVSVIDEIRTDSQIFLVTHNDVIASACDSVVSVFRGADSSKLEQE